MIEQLIGHITQEQLDTLVNVISVQYKKYRRLIDSPEFRDIFAEEYAPHKKQHSVSWAISSAFPSNSVFAGSLVVNRLYYGRGHTRPVLSNDKIELMILNKTTHFQADYLKVRYLYNQHDFAGQKLFVYLKFGVENKRLMFVSLCLPDETGHIIKENMLLEGTDILRIAS